MSSLILQRINNDTLFITSSKGTVYVSLSEVRNLFTVAPVSLLGHDCCVNVKLNDGSMVNITTRDALEGEEIYKYIRSQWEDYLNHCGVLENSSELAKFRVVNKTELLITWGAHNVILAIKDIDTISRSLNFITLRTTGTNYQFKSEKGEFLDNLQHQLLYYRTREV